MLSFRQYLEEGRVSEIVHTNPSPATLKGTAKASTHKSARFVVFKDGTVLAGDAVNFTHHSLESDASKLALRGYVDHDSTNDRYFYTAMHPSKNVSTDDHPFLARLTKHGVRSGNNPDESEDLRESLEYTETKHDIAKGQFELHHEAQVTPHHTLVIKHLVTPGKSGKTYMSTDFGFKEPTGKSPHDIVTQSSHLERPLPREHVVKVMTTVANSTKKTMEKHNVTHGEFNANSDRKNKLYRSAIQRMARRLGGKHHEDDDTQYITIPSNKKGK